MTLHASTCVVDATAALTVAIAATKSSALQVLRVGFFPNMIYGPIFVALGFHFGLLECHPTNQWTCADAACIDVRRRCDGYVDCADGGTDEQECAPKPCTYFNNFDRNFLARPSTLWLILSVRPSYLSLETCPPPCKLRNYVAFNSFNVKIWFHKVLPDVGSGKWVDRFLGR